MAHYKQSEDLNHQVQEAAISYGQDNTRYAQLEVILGGKSTLNKELKNDIDLISISRTGLPKKTLTQIAQKLDIGMERLSALLHVSHRTLQRKSANDHLSVHVSEQILSIAEVIRRGIAVFEDENDFAQWLHSDIPSLDFKKPIEYLDTSFGTQLIIRILGRIEYGVY